MKRSVSFFVSYAHLNSRIAGDFLERLRQQMAPSRAYEYHLWRDTALLVGEDWEREISEALAGSRLGLLLITPAFLASDYVKRVELPHFLGREQKPVIPVLLESVDFQRQDMLGLEAKQIFALSNAGIGVRKAFADCAGTERRHFVEQLFGQIERRLDKILALPPGSIS